MQKIDEDNTELQDWEKDDFSNQSVILKTSLEKCPECNIGKIVPHKRNNKSLNMIVYSRKGTYGAEHLEHICNNQNTFNPCRASFFYSYYKVKGKKIYYDHALKQDILVTSTQTAFEIEYLLELTALVDC